MFQKISDNVPGTFQKVAPREVHMLLFWGEFLRLMGALQGSRYFRCEKRAKNEAATLVDSLSK
jgi:hypothetical protein